MGANLQFWVLAVLNFYMPIRNSKFALRHFCSPYVYACGEEQDADKVLVLAQDTRKECCLDM
jgi:hypothetical protein